MIEPLEPRRLLAADLVASIDATPVIVSNRFGSPGTVDATATVTNQGNVRVFDFYAVRFVLSPDATIGGEEDNDVTLGDVTLTGQAPGGSTTVRFPPALPDLDPGAYHLGVVVDAEDTVTENGETNNAAVTALPVVSVFDAPGVLTINGTDDSDRAEVSLDGGTLNVRVNDTRSTLFAEDVTGLVINLGRGNDFLSYDNTGLPGTVSGGAGDDRIFAGSAPDQIAGGSGKDQVFGGGSRDRIVGNGGHDRLFGQDGADLLYGQAGNDLLDGGPGGDLLNGGAGVDNLQGQSGNDRLFSLDELTDLAVSGGGGTDAALADEDDPLGSIENLLG